MADQKAGFQMKVRGTANGSSSRKAKNGKFYHTGILLIPGAQNNLPISLNDSDPSTFEAGTVIEMNVIPKYWDGRFTGLQEANGAFQS